MSSASPFKNIQQPVIGDHREFIKNKKILVYFDRLGIPVKVQVLDVGDYVFGNVCIERKTLEDLLESLLDGRYYQELMKMADTYPHNFLLVSGSLGKLIRLSQERQYWTKEEKRKKPKPGAITHRIIGALNDAVVDFHVNVYVFIPNTKFLVWTIVNIYKKFILEPEGRDYSHIWDVAPYKRGGNSKVAVLRGIPKIGQKGAKKLLEHFETVKAIANATIEELQDVKDVGEKLATNIWKAFNE